MDRKLLEIKKVTSAPPPESFRVITKKTQPYEIKNKHDKTPFFAPSIKVQFVLCRSKST